MGLFALLTLQLDSVTSHKTFVEDCILTSIGMALDNAVDHPGNCGQKILTVVLCPGTNRRPLDVHVAVAPWHANWDDGSASAVILGGPRAVPIGKDTGWVAERKHLEGLRYDGVSEILLCTVDGRPLEGLVTNIFVVRDDGNGGQVVETAAMEDGVVWGTLRMLVLKACSDLGLKFIEKAPLLEERETWTEAFLTNRSVIWVLGAGI